MSSAIRSCSREGADNRCTLRQLDPIPVGIEHHRDPRGGAERDRRQCLAAAACQHRGVRLINVEHLKRDVAPALAANAGVDAGIAILFEDDAGFAGAERRAERVRLFREPQRAGIEAAKIGRASCRERV